MLNFLYDLVPVLLFFITFKFSDIYTATVVGIIATALQVVITTIWKKAIDKKQVITLVIFLLFGGMTLYFHNPLFVKWKPTVIYWIFGMVFLGSHFIGKRTLIQRLFSSALEKNNSAHAVPNIVWIKLNLAWTLFFTLLGLVNLWVAYNYSTDVWVNFKLYGVMGSLLLFSIAQAFYLARYMTDAE